MIRTLMVGLFLSSSSVWAAEYRSITLADGRVVAAEIQGITSTSMTLATPQGIVQISPQDLRTMESMSVEDYSQLEPWKVLVLPFVDDESEGANEDAQMAKLYALRVLKSIPAVAPLTIDDLPETVPENTRGALSLCGTDLQCATRNGDTVGVDVVVMGDIREKDEAKIFSFGAVFVNAPSARKRVEIPYTSPLINQRKDLTEAVYKSLFLNTPETVTVPTSIEPMVTKQEALPAQKPKTERSIDALAWTPVPGITALKGGNSAGFATALGTVTVGTAASVYIAGQATYSAPQMVAVSALSSYGLTVLVNHIFLK